ncbi:MAG: ureidoglycolate lyase [Proteiniphilum sp.]|nr:ureidoglycolate lyase [Proteiniphilum sp.]
MQAVEITHIDFSPFGIVYDMNDYQNNVNINHSNGEGWEDTNTAFPIIDSLASLGYTLGTGCPFTAAMMERHEHTQEVLMCAGEPIIFLVAKATEENQPDAKDVVPVLLKPGQIAVLHRKTWHSAAHGQNAETHYYWMALCYKNEPTEWVEIKNGPVVVEN